VKLAWSNLAKAALLKLRRSSVERWGRDVAQRYLEDVRAAAKQLTLDPLRAKPLKGPFRVTRVRSHYLIVHLDIAADRLTIARVLHVAMDIERHLARSRG
jgi:plasmid stabilization system protein ParE